MLYPDGVTLAYDINPLQVYKATTNPDTMYFHQAMKEPDREQFQAAIESEWEGQGPHYTLTPISEVPEGATVLPAVWQMNRVQDIMTRQVKKWNACLNIDDS